jgi:hypothetical protein
VNWIAVPRYEQRHMWLYRLECSHSQLLYFRRTSFYVGCDICRQYRLQLSEKRIIPALYGEQ